MNPLRPSSQRRGGFTLIELLCVIGIITVLIGILLPTVTAIRSRAMVTVCQSNLKQMYTGLFMYANDNRDLWPDGVTLGRHGYRMAPGKKTLFDPGALPEVYGLAAILHGISPKDDLTKGMPKPRYIDGNSGIWICPAYREDLRIYGNTYTFNVAELKDPNYTGPSTSAPLLVLNSLWRSKKISTAFVWDNNTLRPGLTGFTGTFNSAYTITPTSARPNAHRLGTQRATASNFLFVDGHVETRIN